MPKAQPTLDEMLRQEGFEQEGTAKLGERPKFDPSVIVYMPLAPESGYEAKNFSAARKAADMLKCGSVYFDISSYAAEGMEKLIGKAQEEQAKLKEKFKDKPEELEKQLKALKEGLEKKTKELFTGNLAKYKKDIDDSLAGVNKAFEGALYAPKVTPPDYQFNTSLYRNIEPDLTGEAAQVGKGLVGFIQEYSKRPSVDLKNLQEGKLLCIVKLGKIKDEEGKESIGIVEARLYRKKESEKKADYKKEAA